MPTETGTVSTKGQVTIPKDIRTALRLRTGDQVVFDVRGGDEATLRRADARSILEILDPMGPTREAGLARQRRLRREWSGRAR